MYHQNKHYTANMIGKTVHLVNFALKSQTTLTTLLGKAKQKHDESKFIQ
jgi:hypothetical protein